MSSFTRILLGAGIPVLCMLLFLSLQVENALRDEEVAIIRAEYAYYDARTHILEQRCREVLGHSIYRNNALIERLRGLEGISYDTETQ